MMKIIAIVLCMSVLVASQEMLGDGFGNLMMMNMLSGGRFNLNSLFGGAGGYSGAQAAQPAAARTAGRGERSQGAAASPLGGLTGLLVFDAI